MNHAVHNKIVSFIWSIADDCLRDVYVRGKYRDVILPMIVLRRLDCLLEESKDAVLDEVKFQREDVKLADLDQEGLRDASGYVFYNTSEFTLKKLVSTASNNSQILEANFQNYLNGFSENVKEIIDKFKLRSLVAEMANRDVLLEVLEKFTSQDINLTPHDSVDSDGRKLPPLTNLGMGYVFEELIRKFNEENNEEAGEHFTPREVIQLMTHILFEPVKDNLPPVITIYDGACGSGGMLTEAQNFIIDPEGAIASTAAVHLYGKEVNDETYAICKSDMMIKGNNPENIKCGSTLAIDDFSGLKFDFMLSNPPYGKSWATDKKYIMDKKDILDPRFEVELKDYWGESETVAATPRSNDGQLLFLMDMAGKMKALSTSPAGSRVASVHIRINQAVTQGLNLDVPMEDSGIDWVGNIPKHWNAKRAKFLFDEIDDRSKAGEEELLSVSHMTGVTPRSEKNIYMFMAEDYAGSKLCKPDDLVFNIMWAWMGALGVSGDAGIVSPSYGVYRQKETGTFNPWYLEHLLRSGQYVAEYNRRSTGLHSSRLRLYSHMFFDMKIGYPDREEQDRIEKETRRIAARIDQVITSVEHEIAALKEMKTVLISEVVTGKIKV